MSDNQTEKTNDITTPSTTIDMSKLEKSDAPIVDMSRLEKADAPPPQQTDHTQSIWDSPDYGRLFEKQEDANIAGNFPTIDDFRDGNATSLKTFNLRDSYQKEDSHKSVRSTFIQYIDKLADYEGRDREERETTYGGVTVRDDDIQSLTLRVGIPTEYSDKMRQAIEEAKEYAKTRETTLGVPLRVEVKEIP